MATITIIENGNLTDSDGQVLRVTPADNTPRVRLMAQSKPGTQFGVKSDAQIAITFAIARGNAFQTSGSLTVQPELKKGEKLLIDISDHNGSVIDVQWW